MNTQASLFTSKPVTVKRGDVFILGTHRLLCGDSTSQEDVERLMQGASVDLAFCDPPYGMGIDAWDVKIADIPAFLALTISYLKTGGFFAFTCQMPYMLAWLNGLEQSGLKYKEHIAWVKRIATTPGAALTRSHENLFIYGNGRACYHTTKGRYEDVKVPGVMFDTLSIEGIKSYISDLRAKYQGNSQGRITKRENYPKYSGYQGTPDISDRSPEYCNFTNVWSFLPEHQHHYALSQETHHPTTKPILLLERLLALCTPDNALVYDAFLGSGTTLLSAEKTGRICYGCELSPTYCEAIIQRWQLATGQEAQLWR